MADQGSEGLLSPFLRRARMNAARPYLSGRILDVGCGSGNLAAWVSPENYRGVEMDDASLERATTGFPSHSFTRDMPSQDEKFDSIVALAVVEHVRDPAPFLQGLAGHLADGAEAKIIITTPHPSMNCIHKLGAELSVFSKHASEEHQELLNKPALRKYGEDAGLDLIHYHRFLLGANQLVLFKRHTPPDPA